MKKYRYILGVIIGVMGMCLCSSCGDDRHDDEFVLKGDISEYVPSYSVSLECNVTNLNGETQILAKPEFRFTPSMWGLTVERVDYYLDDNLIGSESVAPYLLSYVTEPLPSGTHVIRADVYIGGQDINTLVLQCSKNFDSATGTSTDKKRVDVFIDYNHVTRGDTFTIEASLDPSRSEEGMEISSLTVQWDGVEFAKVTNAPFTASRLITEEIGSIHSWMAVVQCKSGDSESAYIYTNTTSLSYPTFEICSDETILASYRIKSQYREYENGEYLRGVARRFIGKDVKGDYKLEVYLEDEMIAQSDEFPFEHAYQLNDKTVGFYKLTNKWIYIENGKEKFSHSNNEYITIVE